MAGDEGFEPPIAEPESAALPLGQSPVFGWLQEVIISKVASTCQYDTLISVNNLNIQSAARDLAPRPASNLFNKNKVLHLVPILREKICPE